MTELFKVVLPSLPEQQQIAAILSAWDWAIESTTKLISAKRKRVRWLVKAMITDSGYAKLPIARFAEEVARRNSTGKEVRILSVTNDRGFVLAQDQFEKRVASADLSTYKVVNKNEYAYNPSRINVGSIARLDDWQSGVLSPMYVVFKLDERVIDSDYFLFWLSSNEAVQRIRNSSQGSVRESVSFSDFRALKIPLPPMQQQENVACVLLSAEREIRLLQKRGEYYARQKKGLMQQLLTGKVRVNMDAQKVRV